MNEAHLIQVLFRLFLAATSWLLSGAALSDARNSYHAPLRDWLDIVATVADVCLMLLFVICALGFFWCAWRVV